MSRHKKETVDWPIAAWPPITPWRQCRLHPYTHTHRLKNTLETVAKGKYNITGSISYIVW